MKFVFVNPPIGRRIVSTTPPVGIAYLSAVLENDGHEVHCILCDAESIDIKQCAYLLAQKLPDVICFSVLTLSAYSVYGIVSEFKKFEIKCNIIFGGPHATIFPEEALKNGADIVVRGEGENTIRDVANHFGGLTKKDEIDGISYIENGIIKHNKDRRLIESLDALPFPAWHLFPVDRFHSDFTKTNRCLPILTSRGCPGRCIFCYKKLFGNTFRMRTPVSIVSEIEYLKNNFNVQEFSIIDDNFVHNNTRAIEVCKLIIERNINLPWGLPSGVRVDAVNKELLYWLKTAGCYRIGFGVESGNQEILKAIRKNVTKEQVYNAIQMAKNEGFVTSAFFMIGNLHETRETVMDSIKFAIELDPDIAQFSVATPYPGTEMYNILESDGKILSKDWDRYDGFSAELPVFVHDNLTSKDMNTLLRKAYRSFYLRPKQIVRIIGNNLSVLGLYKLFRASRKLFRMVVP